MLRNLVLASVAAAGLASAANAVTGVTITSSPYDVVPGAGQQIVFDFNGTTAPGYSYTGGQIFANSVGGVAAAPAQDETPFLAVLGGNTATFSFAKAIKSFSIYIGSVDNYNNLRFQGPGFDTGTFSASVLPGDSTGDQTAGATNRRFFFDFGANRVKTVTLGSTSNSFELDNIAVANVPEPAAWALMIAGFGLVGAAARRRSTAVAA